MKTRNKLIYFSEGTGQNLGKVKNKALSIQQFWDMIRQPLETNETLSQYLRLPDKEQQRLKGLNGFIYRTQVDGKKRNRRSGRPSDMVTLDFDYATPKFFAKFLNREVCPDLYWAMHTSRRHTPEKPRFRVFVFLDEPLSNEDYPAISRIVAQAFDPEMAHVDKVSFRVAQMMFKPTVSRDGVFEAIRCEGELLDWPAMAEKWSRRNGDWRDMDNWPRLDDENLREIAEKAEDPTEKRGVVGDFCRAYDIEEAIAKFLSDVYEPVDGAWAKPRYTYLGGTTSNGAEVQDDGLFLYSHHGSDPCSEMLVNAFDMVRIHKFGKLDDEIDDEKAKALGPTRMPSYKAMVDFVREDDKVRKEMVTRKYDARAMFDDMDEDDSDDDEDDQPEDEYQKAKPKHDMQAREEEARRAERRGEDFDPLWFLDYEVPTPGKRCRKAGSKWHSDLFFDRNGELISNLPNITAILQNDPRFNECIEYNELLEAPVIRVPLRTRSKLTAPIFPNDPVVGDRIGKNVMASIRTVLESEAGEGKVGYGLRVTDRDLAEAVLGASRKLLFHPVKDMLLRSEWDGKKRLYRLAIDFLGTPDNAYYREALRIWMIAAVARTFEPGHKFDFCPILEGPQGIRKSSFFAVLGGRFYGEFAGDLSDEKKVVESLSGLLIVELGELSAMRRSDVEAQKLFITRTESTIREAYARTAQTYRRRNVFCGTTNAETYLQDLTGNRRFWPIAVEADEIDTDALARIAPQLWAEAYAEYVKMREAQPKGTLPLYLTPEAEKIVRGEQASRVEHSEAAVMAEKITAWLLTPRKRDRMSADGELAEIPDEVTRDELWHDVLGNTKSPSKMDIRHLSEAMRLLNWYLAYRCRDGANLFYKYAPYLPQVRSTRQAKDSKPCSGRYWAEMNGFVQSEPQTRSARRKRLL